MEARARTAEERDHQEGEADANEYPREVLREELEDEAGRPYCGHADGGDCDPEPLDDEAEHAATDKGEGEGRSVPT